MLRMIIAHGPLGYLITYSLRRWWQSALTAGQRRVLYFTAFIGGIFPDIDLFYFYLVDSTVSHRQLLTHSILPYSILLMLGCIGIFGVRKLRFYGWLCFVFALGAYSHIAADMIVGMAALLNPFSIEMYGLVSIAWYRDSWFMRYNLVTNFTLEFIIIAGAIGTVIRKRGWWILSIVGTVLVAGLLYWLSQHNYKPDGYFYYSDTDGDGLMNAYDRDLDNDGLVNVIDTDIDQDGDDNGLEIYRQLFAADGSLFDYSYGHLIEVPLRFGLVNPAVLIDRMYANIGIFFGEEMSTDYDSNPNGYLSAPTDNTFSETSDNWIVWLDHTNRLLDAAAPLQEFDLVFFNSGYVALFTRAEGADVVLDVHPSHPYSRYQPLDEVVEREQGIYAIGRLLPNAVGKHY